MSLDHAFFYKSVNGDRVYDDASFEHWLKKFFTSGVFLNDLQVTANEDMTVTVGAGYTNIDGKVKIFTSETPLIIETAGASYPRIDSIVLERNDTERDILLKVVKGGYSSEPVAHTPVRQDGVYQLVIAQILVNAGAVKVSQADITDTRSNTELCGIVAGAVDQIDFSQIQAQFDSYIEQYKKQLEEEHAEHNADMDAYLEQMEAKTDQMEADFATWFEGIRNQLDEDAAGHLQNQIDDINARLEYAGGSMVEITVESNDEEYNVVGLELNLEIDGKTYTKTIPSEKVVVFTGVLEVGTATITCVDEAQEIDASASIEITYYGAYETSITFSSGSYEKWIEAGGLNPSSYETLDDLLEDEAAIRTLMTKKAAVDTLAEFKGGDLATIINHPYVAKWANYREYAYSTLSAVPEIKTIMDASGMYGMYITMAEPRALVPKLTSYIGSDGGEAFASSEYNSNCTAYKAFNFNGTTHNYDEMWLSASGLPAYIGYKFTKPTKVSMFAITNSSTQIYSPTSFALQGSNDNSKWDDIQSYTNSNPTASTTSHYVVENGNYYLYYRLNVMSVVTGACAGVTELQFYGYQEDDTLWQPKGLVPVMTSDTAPYGEAFASTVYGSGYEAFHAFDFNGTHNYNVMWHSTKNIPAHLGYKFTNPTSVRKFSLTTANNDLHLPTEFTLQGSNGTEWVDIQTYTETPLSNTTYYYDVTNENCYMSYRLNFTKSVSGEYVNVTELQFYGRQLESLIPPMTSNTTPIGEASASDVYTSGYEEYKAFDNSNSTCWLASTTSNQYIQYKFNNATKVTSVFIKPHHDNKGIHVGNFKVQGSNNGDVWNDLVSGVFSNEYTDGRYFTIKKADYYTFYRVLVIDQGGAANAYIGITTFQLYGTPDYDSRTYIYDHGVEVMDFNYLVSSGGVAAKEDGDEIYLASGSAASASYARVQTNVDLTNYSLIRARIGSVISNVTSNAASMGVYDDSTDLASTWFNTSNIPFGNLDVNNISGTHRIELAADSSYSAKVKFVTWWLE